MEDAARDAIDSISSVDDMLKLQLFMAVVKCLNRELDLRQASSNYALDHQLLTQCVHKALQLLGRDDDTVVNGATAAAGMYIYTSTYIYVLD